MARCYILASMSNILQHHHENMATAYDMMMNLKEMFGEQNRAGRQVAMKALLNTKMAEGTPVQDHVLKMISHLNELEILGAEIDGESQVDIVLMSLPESYKNFRLNYSMSKGNYSLAELLKELQAAEGILGQAKSVQVMEKGSSSSSAKKNKKKKKAPKPAGASKQKTKKGDAKPRNKCFTCGQVGHWKKDCPKYKARTQNGQSSGMSLCLVTESYLLACTTGTWCVDVGSGAAEKVCGLERDP